MLLIDARARRDEARRHLVNGTDPAAAKKDNDREERLKTETTFTLVACEWHALYKDRWSPGHAATILHRMETDIFPEIGTRPVSAITASELLAVIRKIEERGAHEMARRATQICGQVFRYAIMTDRAERNPASDLISSIIARAVWPIITAHSRNYRHGRMAGANSIILTYALTGRRNMTASPKIKNPFKLQMQNIATTRVIKI